MRVRHGLLFLALVMALIGSVVPSPAGADPVADGYAGPYFGDGNLPPGCITDTDPANPANVCYHMKTGLNGLDSPQIDVLVLLPVSPAAERDMRIMRQAIEMWEGGIQSLAGRMGLTWLAEGVDFHITVDYIDPDGEGGNFTTYPIVDPEIVVVATNPVGGVGIGFDPGYLGNALDNAVTDGDPLVFGSEDLPCHGIANPLDFEAWENLPGFDSHHGTRSGTYTEDCGGKGGNICFAVNGAVDPAPDTIDVFNMFDLVAHEVGHCLTIGHVGDGADGPWGPVASSDIMSYAFKFGGVNKCVSTLDVEGFALRMSRYLDVDGDGLVGAADPGDRLQPNDVAGDGFTSFHVQHPDDFFHASATGSYADCPQPDLGVIPGPRTNWKPTPVGPGGGTPPATASFVDADDDASAPVTEILSLDVEVTATHVEADIAVEKLWPSTAAFSPVSYSFVVDGRRFDSFVRYPVDANPMTWDSSASAYMPAGTSTWDLATNTVTFRIPKSYLAGVAIESPFQVNSFASTGFLSFGRIDDHAPEQGTRLTVAG